MPEQDVPAANTTEFKTETQLMIIRETTQHQTHASLHSIGRGTNVGLERCLATHDNFITSISFYFRPLHNNMHFP